MTACAAEGQWVAEEPYEADGDTEYPDSGAPRRSRLAHLRQVRQAGACNPVRLSISPNVAGPGRVQERGILDGVSVYLCGPFEQALDALEDLVVACGGRVAGTSWDDARYVDRGQAGQSSL